MGLCGDLLNGRTVHSLCKALSCYKNNHFVLISTPELRLPFYVKDIIKANGGTFTEVSSLDQVSGSLDVLYMTRTQQERFTSEEADLAQKDTYVLDAKKMSRARPDMIVLHPLPRVDEITVEVDQDPRAMYFKQAHYGMYVRMALIMTMLENQNPSRLLKGKVHKGVCCKTPSCIPQQEHYLPKSFRGEGTTLECEYCDERLLLEH